MCVYVYDNTRTVCAVPPPQVRVQQDFISAAVLRLPEPIRHGSLSAGRPCRCVSALSAGLIHHVRAGGPTAPTNIHTNMQINDKINTSPQNEPSITAGVLSGTNQPPRHSQ